MGVIATTEGVGTATGVRPGWQAWECSPPPSRSHHPMFAVAPSLRSAPGGAGIGRRLRTP